MEFRIEPETGLVYDGTEKKGYVGTPEVMSGNYTSGEYTVSYTNAEGEQLDSAPIDAGKYTVTVSGSRRIISIIWEVPMQNFPLTKRR